MDDLVLRRDLLFGAVVLGYFKVEHACGAGSAGNRGDLVLHFLGAIGVLLLLPCGCDEEDVLVVLRSRRVLLCCPPRSVLIHGRGCERAVYSEAGSLAGGAC